MLSTVFMVSGTALLLGLLTGTANATPATNDGCPTGYEPATFEEIVATPEVQAALRDDVYGVDHVADVFSEINKNGDALVCWKSVGNDDNTHFMVYYAGRYADNHAGPEK